ncbi:MAG TPA: UbiA family prenyltransferase, partial [Salinivirgaceae bacterium]|nr:UbiA family prenyltransferase [Salinivirgaceae bacterium]
MGKIKLYLSLVKFSHTLFAMPFAIVGFFIATNYYNYGFDIETLVYVLLCMVFVRNAAMAFNRYVDKRFDKENERTSGREIPKGLIKPSNALIFVIINSAAFIVVTWFINRLCFYLSPIVLLVVLGYSFTKRFTFISHYILGIGLGLAPIGAFLAVSGEFRILPIL